MSEILYAQALADGLEHALGSDDAVHVIGQYFVGLTPHRARIAELSTRYPDRFNYPPIAEAGYVGMAIGAAMAGLRPIVDIGTASFMFQAMGQLANEAANARYMSGGTTAVPLVLHCNHGIRGGGAAQHSHSPQAMLWNTPGLRIIAPSTPADLRGLLLTAVAADDPVVWLDHVKLFDTAGPVPSVVTPIPFGRADVKRAGADVTIIASSYAVLLALRAAEVLAGDGIDAEVLDLRSLVPLDEDAIIESATRTRRVVVVDEGHRRSGVAAEISAVLMEKAFDGLSRGAVRVTAADVPIPFSPALERAVSPTTDRIVGAVRSLF